MSFSMISFLLGIAGVSMTVAVIAASIFGLGFFWGLISFFRSPLGLIALGIALYFAGNFIGYNGGWRDMAARCEAEKLASIEAAKRMDAEIASKSAAERKVQEKEETDRVADFERRIADYERKLEASGGDPCRATDDDAGDDGVSPERDLPNAAPLPADSFIDRPSPIPRPAPEKGR